MIVAGLQFDIAWEDPDENFRRVEELAAMAVDDGARLLVLPEMFATGFSMNTEVLCDHTDRIREFLSDLARRHETFVIGGYAEPGDPRPRNACSLTDPTGAETLRYRKIHPFSLANEQEHYDGGDAVHTIEVDGLRVTPLICYDLRFPEPFRAAAAGTDLFVVIANWPRKRREPWSLLLRARAVENQCFVLGLNRVGEAAGEFHSGDSALIDPFGRTLVEKADEPGIVSGHAHAAAVADARKRFSFLADRRPEVYDKLNEEIDDDRSSRV
jgi:omega-amidase